MVTTKQIVMFSGGANSSYLAWLVVQEYGKENTVLLHTPTYAEHPDADRFRLQVAKYIGLPITVVEDGRSLWQLIEQYKAIPDDRFPFCTKQLKIAQSNKYWNSLKNKKIDFVVYYGYGSQEWRRVQKTSVRLEAQGIKSRFLIFKKQIPDEQIKKIIKNDWNICLPESYKHLKHNNCIPCFKGGKGHFRKVAKYYPKQFLRAAEMEELTGFTVFKDCSLKDIWEEVQQSKKQLELFDDGESIPCMCAI